MFPDTRPVRYSPFENEPVDGRGDQRMTASTVERFSNRVENYAKYRPGYPPEVLELFKNELGLMADSVLADIGSGTGISSRLFVENGNTVYGVEPNDAMRAAGEQYLAGFPTFQSV